MRSSCPQGCYEFHGKNYCGDNHSARLRRLTSIVKLSSHLTSYLISFSMVCSSPLIMVVMRQRILTQQTTGSSTRFLAFCVGITDEQISLSMQMVFPFFWECASLEKSFYAASIIWIWWRLPKGDIKISQLGKCRYGPIRRAPAAVRGWSAKGPGRQLSSC